MTERRKEPTNVVYITNIPLFATEADIEGTLRKFGLVNSVFLKEVSNKQYQFSFVTFDEEKVASKLIKDKKVEIHGRTCFVKPRHPKKSMDSTVRIQKNIEQSIVQAEPEPDMLCVNNVVRVEGIPYNWNAQILYEHLLETGIVVKAAFSYIDANEKLLCSGLLEFETLDEAQLACGFAKISTKLVTLEIVRSTIASIDQVRKTYKGAFTYFGENTETDTLSTYASYGYSVAEPFEPNFGEHTITSVAFKPQLSAIQESFSPMEPNNWNDSSDCSPQMAFKEESVTPMSEVSDDDLASCQKQPKETEKFTTSYTSSYKSAKEELSLDTAFSPNGVFKSYRSDHDNDILCHKPSATVIIEQMSTSFTPNAHALAMWMEQFGDVRSADLVSTSKDFYRAYVSYWNPINADIAHYNLISDDFSSLKFDVRMA